MAEIYTHTHTHTHTHTQLVSGEQQVLKRSPFQEKMDDFFNSTEKGKQKNLKTNQSGRTMVEMLGVLFIIGLLSIAGLSMYRYAMRKITVNKLMDIVTHYTASLEEELLLRKKIYGGIACSQSDANSVAEKCIFEATDHLCDLYLGNEYCQDKYTLPSYSYQYAGYYVAPDVVFSVVPQSNNITLNIHFPRELCIPFMELLTAMRPQLDSDGLWQKVQFYGLWSDVAGDNYQTICAQAPLQHFHKRLRLLITTKH